MWPECIVVLEHGIEVCCPDFTTAFCAQIRAFGLQDNSLYYKGFLRLVIRDWHTVALGGPIGSVLLVKNGQLLIPEGFADSDDDFSYQAPVK
jgi:hypothetical protein